MTTANEPLPDAVASPPRFVWTAMPSTRSHLQEGQMRTVDVHVNICSTFACDALGQMLPIWARDILGLSVSFAWAPYGHGLSVLEEGSETRKHLTITASGDLLPPKLLKQHSY